MGQDLWDFSVVLVDFSGFRCLLVVGIVVFSCLTIRNFGNL